MQIIRELLKLARDRPKGRIRVSKLLNGKTAVNRVRVMRLKYWAHIQRREQGHPLKSAERLEFTGKKRGRPAKTWNDTIREDKNKLMEISETEWHELAKNKTEFKKKVEEIYNTIGSEEESSSEIE